MAPTEAFYLATLAGASALGLEDTIGNFAPQKDADFVVLNSTIVNPTNESSKYRNKTQILKALCNEAREQHIEQVYVQGQQIHQTL